MKEVEQEKQRRALLKEYRDRGEDVPDELKKGVTNSRKGSGKGLDKSSGRKKKELKPEVKALLAGLEPGKGRSDQQIAKWEEQGKARDAVETDDEDDEMSEKPTRPTFDWAYKKKETEKRNKIKLDSAFFESGGKSNSSCLAPRVTKTDHSRVFVQLFVDTNLILLHLHLYLRSPPTTINSS